jgi:hypothetical protein
MNATSAAYRHTSDKMKEVHDSLVKHLNGERDAGDYDYDKVTFNRGTKKEFSTHLHVLLKNHELLSFYLKYVYMQLKLHS